MIERPQNILIIGGGGREDALAWKLRQSPWVNTIYMAPGNGGSERFGATHNISLDWEKFPQVMEAARDLNTGLVVIGPEDPLIHGLVDQLRQEGIPTFGPEASAARLEGSKVYALEFMQKNGIPFPYSGYFGNYQRAVEFVGDCIWWRTDSGLVIKADGPAGGKGVFVCSSPDEAVAALTRLMVEEEFGESGRQVVIQRKISGFEVSATLIVDKDRYLLLPFCEDHKQINDGDQGPNTGGMGVAAPHPRLTTEQMEAIVAKVIQPTLVGLMREGLNFRGVLYPGIMMTMSGPKVLEFNVRFGDPETQTLLPLLEDDLFPLLYGAASTEIEQAKLKIKRQSSVSVTLAAAGYPGKPETGQSIQGLEETGGVTIFHAGTRRRENGYETKGGRVLTVVATGDSLIAAREKVYSAIGPQGVNFDKMQYRKDIGLRK